MVKLIEFLILVGCIGAALGVLLWVIRWDRQITEHINQQKKVSTK